MHRPVAPSLSSDLLLDFVNLDEYLNALPDEQNPLKYLGIVSCINVTPPDNVLTIWSAFEQICTMINAKHMSEHLTLL